MEAYYPYFWLFVILVAIAVESMTMQMVSIWMVVGGAAALIAALLDAPFLGQLAVFVLVTGLMLAVTRPLVRKLMRFKKVDTNADRYIGKNGVVTLEINNTVGQGQVNVLGSVWTARSADGSVIPAGENVLVRKIEGVKLIVEPGNQKF